MILKRSVESNKPVFLLRFGRLLFMAGAIMMLSIGAYAQGPGGGDLDDPDAPFDGGVSVLVAAGVAYGVKRWRDARKDNQSEEQNEKAENL